jgi:predicted acyl esterase/glycerophosphoryl diester phosphodiesterase
MSTLLHRAWLYVALAIVPFQLAAANPALQAGGVKQIIAHRGASLERPECTLASVRRAIDVGATAVEVDVRTSADGQLFILHDTTLNRTTNGKGAANKLTLAQLQQLDAGSWFDKKFKGERIPSLREALAACKGKVDILLDLKEQGDVYDRRVADSVKKHGDPARTVLGVRSVSQAKRFRKLLPKAQQLGLIPNPDSIEPFAKVGVETIRLWPKWLAADDKLVARVKKSGAKLHLNGTNGSPEEVAQLLIHAPFSLSSDDPNRLVFTLKAFAEERPPLADAGGVVEKHIWIPMRDGVRLSAWVYFPNAFSKSKGPWPCVFEQRYAFRRHAGTRRDMARLAKAGFVSALVSFRGAQRSEGKWVGYRALQWGKLRDGYDACEWFAKQKWCTGKVGTFGASQGGYSQNYLAVTRSPHLVCQYMVDTGLSLFHEGYRIGGATKPERFKGMDANCRVPRHNRELMAEWFTHPHYDDYWRDEDCTLHFSKMNVPCMTIGSWYDFMNQGSIGSFVGRQHKGGAQSRGRQQLLIGPWLHGRRNKGNRVAQMQYPANAAWDVHAHMVRWFNHHLKGVANGVMDDSPVRYYVMGAVGEKNAPGNIWRTAKDWPPAAKATSMYLQKSGSLSTQSPPNRTGGTSYISDPRKPMSIPARGFPGARDARAFEKQKEVLTFTTAPLKKPVEWTGRVHAELFISSTARDTDFIVRISDVYPDGRSILIIDYPLRARYREGFEKEVLMEPGTVYKFRWPIGWLSQIFNKGHRIRVTIASTGAPYFEPNPQTGKPLTIEFPADAQKATNTIHHNHLHQSRIIAPVATK